MAQAAKAPAWEDWDGEHPVIEFPGKYLSVTTYRRDGTAVATPVWFVQEGRHLYIETGEPTGKVKRIRANPKVSIAPCTPSGRLRGERVEATADVLAPEARAHVEELMAKKYRVDKIVILPIYNLFQRLRHKAVPRDQQRPVVVEITPVPETGRGAP